MALIDTQFGSSSVTLLLMGLALAGCTQSNASLETGSSAEVKAGTDPKTDGLERSYVDNADGDHDGIRDGLDQCPKDAETANGINDHDGCPDDAVVIFRDTVAVIDEKIFFESEQAELLPQGQKLLDQIATEYDAHRDEWSSISITGHADHLGSQDYNEDLAKSRAGAVAEYLISKGIPREKLEVKSYGERKPAVVGSHSSSAHAANRRVEFTIKREGS